MEPPVLELVVVLVVIDCFVASSIAFHAGGVTFSMPREEIIPLVTAVRAAGTVAAPEEIDPCCA